jgi:hypothetical protein
MHSEPVVFLPKASTCFLKCESADLLSFGGVGVSGAPGLLYCLQAYDPAKMRPVYSLFAGLTDISAFFG